jgi:hypothetical protein
VLAGSHEAIGVLVPDASDVLRWWEPGAVVWHVDESFLVRFPSPRRLRSDAVRGELVIVCSDVLTTVPIDAPPPNASAGSLVRARAGALFVTPLLERVDPSAWLARDRVTVLAPIEVERAPSEARDALPPVATDARDAIGDAIPRAAEGAREAAESIARSLAKSGSAVSVPSLPPAKSAFGTLRDWLGRWVFGQQPSTAAQASSKPSSDLAPIEPREPSWLHRVWDGLGWLSARAFRARLARYVTRRQAEYVMRYLELFDRGDVNEALRWAIPLGSGSTAETPAPPSLGTPGARASLALTGRRVPASSTFGVGLPDLHAFLKARYLRVLEALKERGEIDQAAFVLAELLGDADGAVALLERHGRLLQAARLAEAREVDPAVQVRLWMLARDLPRALALARRHAAFASAIAALRPSHPQAADALALEWGNELAQVGDFAGAVMALRDVPTGLPLRRAWLERAIDVGGVAGAQMLAVRATEAPDRFDDTAARLRELLGDRAEEREPEVEAFARELVAPRASSASEVDDRVVRALAAPTLRELWRRGSRLASTLEAHVDGALRADRPPALRPTHPIPDPIALTFDASDVGALPVHDLALLPSGKLVVALGEAGVRVYARDGRHVATIDAPADALVTSDHGSYVIAVARRGELHRLTRIDLDRRIARPWWEARLTSFARTFDGTRWLLSEGGVATSIDATDDRWSALARLPDVQTIYVDRAGDRALLIASDDRGATFDRWTYDVGLRRLHRRETHDVESQLARLGGRTAEVVITQSDDVVSITRLRESWKRDLPRAPLFGAVRIDDTLAVVPSRGERGVEVEVLQKAPFSGSLVKTPSTGPSPAEPPRKPQPVELALLELQGTQRCAIALTAPLVAIGDDLGRVLVLDVLRARVRLDLRIRA